MAFLEVIGTIGGVLSIAGVSAKDLIPFIKDPDRKLFNNYFTFLEGKRVLVAPFDEEVTDAVIKSLESIKVETENLRTNINSEQAKHLVLDLVHTLSKELISLYRDRDQNSKNEVLFYKSLQKIRVKFARVLSILCSTYQIDLSKKQTDLSRLVLEHAYRV
ncbi:hypothetical protein [Providencia sp. PROV111]|uniref:hypothetical protein n=1 Tax=Providencia sp. PROV111 TaxID=2949822 RepID=UPI00234BCC69|nr:hypothetical protein [Providencia sp. PROV111]